MESFVRAVTLERGALDMSTGRFPATLATDGEASDGHILSIEGAEIADRIPLQFSHRSELMAPVLGSIVEPKKTRSALKVVGVVNLSGDDPLAEIRRGFAQLIHDGDLSAMSVSWSGSGVPRAQLPIGHAAALKKSSPPQAQYGLFFDRWRATEGSVVAVGADPKALMGRAESCTGHVRTFFMALARNAEGDNIADIAAGFAALGDAINGLRALGITEFANHVNAVAGILGIDSTDIEPYRMSNGEVIFVPPGLIDEIRNEASALVDLSAHSAEETVSTEQRSEMAQESAPPAVERAPQDIIAEYEQVMAQRIDAAVSEILFQRLGRIV